MAKEENLDQCYLQSILSYCPESGLFRWKARPQSHFKTSGACRSWNTRYSGKLAGTEAEGRIRIRIKVGDSSPVQYSAHRLAWLYVNGEWPDKDKVVDHIDGNACNNAITNLRVVDHVVNNRNKTLQNNNTSGRVGVYWSSLSNKWVAQGVKDGKSFFLGYSDDLSEACEIRERWEASEGNYSERNGTIA